MINQIEIGLKEIWDIKEEMYSDFKSGNFSNYYDFIKNEIKNLEFNFYKKNEKEEKQQITAWFFKIFVSVVLPMSKQNASYNLRLLWKIFLLQFASF